MIDLYTLSPVFFKQTKRLLRDEFRKRGWQAFVPYPSSSIISIVRDDGVKLDINSSTPPTTSYVAAKIADDKFATYNKLSDLTHIRQLETIMLKSDESDRLIGEMLDRHAKIVVKPIDGSHGNGVTTNISTLVDAQAAIADARSTSSNSTILVQAQYETTASHEVRMLCIDGKYVAAIYRQPARVFGDGTHTVAELIEIENEQLHRGAAYVEQYTSIDMAAAAVFLGDAMNSIPGAGQQVNVLGVANYGTGGETIDVTEEIPSWMAQDAIDIAEHVGLPLAGIDFILKAYPSSQATREDLHAAVLEINRSPSLGIHQEPTGGTSRDVITAYVDYLATLR